MSQALSLAGFQVNLIGRIWVPPEGRRFSQPNDAIWVPLTYQGNIIAPIDSRLKVRLYGSRALKAEVASQDLPRLHGFHLEFDVVRHACGLSYPLQNQLWPLDSYAKLKSHAQLQGVVYAFRKHARGLAVVL